MRIGLNNLGLTGGGNRFSPTSLFLASEQGVWYDPSDFSSMYQDSGATTPVTAVGQTVGKILDKSGKGNHLAQATTAARPILRQDASGFYYLEFDGVDDFLQSTATIDFSASDKLTWWTGVVNSSTATAGIIFELSTIYNTSAGSFAAVASGVSSGDWAFTANGNAAAFRYTAGAALPRTNVLSCQIDLAQASTATEILPRVNAATVALTESGASAGTGNFGNYSLYLGKRAGTTLPFAGRMYQLVIRSTASTANVVSTAERFVGGKMGIYL